MSSPGSHESVPGSPEQKILVVDDDPFLRDVLQRFLVQLGYSVVTAEHSDEALDAVRRNTFDAGIIDIMLVGMDGLELVNELRREQPEMILIMMTGHPSLETALEAMKRGVQDYLIKPFKLEQLDKSLRRCLEEKRILQENRGLKKALQEAEAKIENLESLIRQTRIHPRPGPADSRQGPVAAAAGDAVYRSQSRSRAVHAMEENLNKLDRLRDEGLISEDEYRSRRSGLLHSQE